MHLYNKSKARPANAWGESEDKGLVLLAVGDPGRLPDGVTSGDEVLEGVHFVGIEDVSRDFIDLIDADIVLSPLVSTRFDCLELAERLDAIGFVGRYRIVVDHLPRPDLIRREISEAYPALDCDVLTLNRPHLRVVH